MPPWITKDGILATLKALAIAFLLWKGLALVQGYVADQKALRAKAEHAVALQAQVGTLQQAATDQQTAAAQQAQALRDAAAAMQGVNANFSQYRRDQQQLLRALREHDLDAEARADPAKAAADATGLSRQLDTQFEALYP